MTDRQLIAYALILLLAVALAAIVWWWRYQSYPRTYEREQKKRRKQSEARSLAHMAAADRKERP